ncbi:MAG: CDP-diacylglycerol--glycerol-3-phosphate 3-phosphatidyltransferase [Planctomycetota bacterium]|nr:MAG: CDP-diacylglycerol--glycerol-3-phosphate 3-phosphatidyltransferase [Planctomycetota bacterium]
MSIATEKPAAKQQLFNVPNQLTALRLLLSIVLFVFVALEYYLTSMVLFIIAAGTDWADGYWARKYGQVTNVGRIFDPFVDKIIICGTFIFLAAVPGSGIAAWMAVVVVGRELLVTALRSYLEGEGADFSASRSGKLKMVLQCVAAALSLFALYRGAERPEALDWALVASVWGAVLLTLYSGVAYIQRAFVLLRAAA